MAKVKAGDWRWSVMGVTALTSLAVTGVLIGNPRLLEGHKEARAAMALAGVGAAVVGGHLSKSKAGYAASAAAAVAISGAAFMPDNVPTDAIANLGATGGTMALNLIVAAQASERFNGR